MQPIMQIRSKYQDQFEKRHGIKLGFMSFYVKAVCEALKRDTRKLMHLLMQMIFFIIITSTSALQYRQSVAW